MKWMDRPTFSPVEGNMNFRNILLQMPAEEVNCFRQCSTISSNIILNLVSGGPDLSENNGSDSLLCLSFWAHNLIMS